MRYVTFKIKDMEEVLSLEEQRELNELTQKIQEYRISSGKEPLEGLFIDRTWPIFPSVQDQLVQFIGASNVTK